MPLEKIVDTEIISCFDHFVKGTQMQPSKRAEIEAIDDGLRLSTIKMRDAYQEAYHIMEILRIHQNQIDDWRCEDSTTAGLRQVEINVDDLIKTLPTVHELLKPFFEKMNIHAKEIKRLVKQHPERLAPPAKTFPPNHQEES